MGQIILVMPLAETLWVGQKSGAERQVAAFTEQPLEQLPFPMRSAEVLKYPIAADKIVLLLQSFGVGGDKGIVLFQPVAGFLNQSQRLVIEQSAVIQSRKRRLGLLAELMQQRQHKLGQVSLVFKGTAAAVTTANGLRWQMGTAIGKYQAAVTTGVEAALLILMKQPGIQP